MWQDAAPKHVGMVGPCPTMPSGAPQDPNLQVQNPPFCIFMCVMLKRVVGDRVGPMDEITFDGFSSEDLDYSWRIVKAGLELRLSRAYVMHAGSRTLVATVGDAEKRRANDAKYNARLREKWGDAWVTEHTKTLPRVLIATYHAEEWTRVSFMGAF